MASSVWLPACSGVHACRGPHSHVEEHSHQTEGRHPAREQTWDSRCTQRSVLIWIMPLSLILLRMLWLYLVFLSLPVPIYLRVWEDTCRRTGGLLRRCPSQWALEEMSQPPALARSLVGPRALHLLTSLFS